MKRQGIKEIGWRVFAAAGIIMGISLHAVAQGEIEAVSPSEDYYVEWVKPEYPPLPPVTVNGVLLPWEAVYGPPPVPEVVPVLRPKNPKPPEPYDPQKRWVEIKRRLAPWMTEEQLRAKPAPSPELEIAKRRAKFKAGFVPKMTMPIATETTHESSFANEASAGMDGPVLMGGEGGGYGPMENGGSSPSLHLAEVFYDPLGFTRYTLWVMNAPTSQWFELYFSDELNPNRWSLAHVGPPESGYGTSLQEYSFIVPGHIDQGYFQAFIPEDSDGDGLTDGMEIAVFKSDPHNPDSAFLRDADGDGLPDFPNAQGNWIVDGDEDFDGDGLSNLKELQMGTDPLVPQDYFTDSNSNGLPDWVEELIYIYTGNPNPGLFDDSDGDGIDNYTEVALLTDPSWPDAVYSYSLFYNLPDHRRAFLLPAITVQHTASSDPDSQNDLICNNAGTLGSVMHLEVRRNKDGNGDPLTGYDTIHFGGAFISPPAMYLDLLPVGSQPSDAFISLSDLLSTGTSLVADIWDEAQVSDLINQLNMQELLVIQQRSMQRTVVRMREMQLTVDFADPSTGTQMRLRRAISEIHTETVIFRKTSARIAQIQGHNWHTRAGFWVSGAGRVASVFSIGVSAANAWATAQDYIFDVRRRCDNSFDTAGDFAVALGTLASNWAPTFMLGNFWLVYWNQLIQFDGYDSACF